MGNNEITKTDNVIWHEEKMTQIIEFLEWRHESFFNNLRENSDLKEQYLYDLLMLSEAIQSNLILLRK